MKVEIKKRWTRRSSIGGYTWLASGKCNRKKFRARLKWYGNLTGKWTVEDENYERDPRFNKTELQAIGREIRKPERIRRQKRLKQVWGR